MRRGNLDIVYGALILASGGLLMWETTTVKYANVMGLGVATDPAFYPQILLSLWMLIGVVLMAQGVIRRGRGMPRQDWRLLAGTVAIVSLYALLITTIGFLLASIALCVAMMLLQGYRRMVVVAAVSVIFPLVTWYTFVSILRIPLPVSPWFDRF